jgi:putative DNA methylase
MKSGIYWRKLPHWRRALATYFVTWRLHPNQASLAPNERDVVLETLRHHDRVRFLLVALVVMDDHVHVIVEPMGPLSLEQIIHSWKSVSAHRLQRQFGRRSAIWQREYHDRLIRRPGDLPTTIRYIRENPTRRWPELPEYPWLWWDKTRLQE